MISSPSGVAVPKDKEGSAEAESWWFALLKQEPPNSDKSIIEGEKTSHRTGELPNPNPLCEIVLFSLMPACRGCREWHGMSSVPEGSRS